MPLTPSAPQAPPLQLVSPASRARRRLARRYRHTASSPFSSPPATTASAPSSRDRQPSRRPSRQGPASAPPPAWDWSDQPSAAAPHPPSAIYPSPTRFVVAH